MRWITKKPRESGQQAERFAERYLLKQGYRFVTRNFNTKVGEIDLIMQDKEELVFVEVRSRSPSQYASALESIDYYKQQRLLRTAEIYLYRQFKDNHPPCRFDVIALQAKVIPNDYEIVWIKDAFGG